MRHVADFREMTCRACLSGEGLGFQISMAFQPIVSLSRDRVVAQEALVRGTDGAGAASVLARVDDTNRYHFDQACRVNAVKWASDLGVGADCDLHINFMPNAIYRPEVCIRTTLAAARAYDFPRDRLVFEVTEDEPIRDHDHLADIFREYRRLGFKTAIDDFGAGYAGLNLLADFQPDIVKIDMHLIRGVDADKKRRAIVRGIVTVCEELGITVIAEGIETVDELAAVRDLGVDLVQGYLIAKPRFEGLAEPAIGASGALPRVARAS
ncbi:MAG: EAL domain-containing protein [Myxococcales bacterium]|nr:EAL domain-containing protein [Myxococcales bacterium]